MAKNFLCSKTEPVVATKKGKIRGFLTGTTYTFHGIKYANAKRFQSPTEVEPWDGIKDALSYGLVCPMLTEETAVGELMVPHRYWPKSEDCQYLNIWTQSIDKSAKKPVMLWLHGGGYFAGSSIEQVAYDGENLSVFGDVVVVSLNHRLNILGYLDLSHVGDEFKNSANAGNEDMVAALRFIRDNIENFGGDPENVTLFGQSGGGMKVWNLMQTPEADGLFSKCIVQSGLIDFLSAGKGSSVEIVDALVKELNLSSAHELQTVPYAILASAYNKVSPYLSEKGLYVGNAPIPNYFYVGDPRIVGFTEHAKKIPVLIGTVFGEFAFGPGIANKKNMSNEEAKEIIHQKYKDKSEEMIKLFKEAYPNKDLVDVINIDSVFRAPTIDFIAKKSLCTESEIYSYMFNFEFPFDDGKPAWHCSEIPFVFHNIDKVPICNKGDVSKKLEEQICLAWINFAKTGNPNNEHLPNWEACKENIEKTMIFDEVCEVKENYDHSLVKLHVSMLPELMKDEEVVVLH